MKDLEDKLREVKQKDREIILLKREFKKKELLAKRKQEEYSALVKKTKSDKQK